MIRRSSRIGRLRADSGSATAPNSPGAAYGLSGALIIQLKSDVRTCDRRESDSDCSAHNRHSTPFYDLTTLLARDGHNTFRCQYRDRVANCGTAVNFPARPGDAHQQRQNSPRHLRPVFRNTFFLNTFTYFQIRGCRFVPKTYKRTKSHDIHIAY